VTQYLVELTDTGEKFLMEHYPNNYGMFVGSEFIVHETDHEGEFIHASSGCKFYAGGDLYPDEILIIEELDFDSSQEGLLP